MTLGSCPHTAAQPTASKWTAQTLRKFLSERCISLQDIDTVWTAIALHTTPGIPEYMHPVIALLIAGVEMDVLGIKYCDYPDEVRNAIVTEYPRTPHFKEDILQTFVSVRPTHAVVAGGLVMHLSYERSGSGAAAPEPGRGCGSGGGV
jgi:hypothetical protein